MKKSMCAFLLSLFALTLVACGDNVSAAATPEVSEEVDTIEYREFDGEGEGQGVIKSDDELSALEEEAEQHSSGEDYDTYVIESKEEVANTSSYIPMDDYWLSDNQFDLLGWLKANNATVYMHDMYGDFQKDENEDVCSYEARFKFEDFNWQIAVYSSTEVRCLPTSTNTNEASFSSEKNSRKIVCNDFGYEVYEDTLSALECAVSTVKNNPEGAKELLWETSYFKKY